ncbi:diguanylate cyclase domain-containing protein [Paenibacillus sp. TAB 01]|uniref:diguanylate cyclase domain-containing protein n=1 Tax=Paenibacillus sp. TAB 01 TaxID=3368988 RepID=UPI00374FF0F0
MSIKNKIYILFMLAVALLLILNNALLYVFNPSWGSSPKPQLMIGLLLLFAALLLGYGFVEYLQRSMRSMLDQFDEEIDHKNQQIDFYANHDFLTGLPNRILFKERCRAALEQSKQLQQSAAILFLDLDRFKIVNDMFGHSTGDDLLRAVSRRLQQHIRFGDTVSRIEGDEFALMLGNASRDEAVRIAQLLLDELSKPFVLEGNEFFVTPSIGISLYPGDAADEETLVKHADTAMYQAKEMGRNHYRFYTSDMNERIAKRLRLEKGLRKAFGPGGADGSLSAAGRFDYRRDYRDRGAAALAASGARHCFPG